MAVGMGLLGVNDKAILSVERFTSGIYDGHYRTRGASAHSVGQWL